VRQGKRGLFFLGNPEGMKVAGLLKISNIKHCISDAYINPLGTKRPNGRGVPFKGESMKTVDLMLGRKENATKGETESLLTWRIVEKGKTPEGRDTHDENGDLIVAPYRDRHIVDGFQNIICEFVHEEGDAKIISVAPLLAAAVEHLQEMPDGSGVIDAEGMRYIMIAMKRLWG
jgi:hypothetical protein